MKLKLLNLFILSSVLSVNAQNFAWAKAMGGTQDDAGNSIAVDASGNVYTTGSFKGTADFDPGVGTCILTAGTSGTDIFISKLDASGNFVWAKSMVSAGGGGSSNCVGNSIAVDASGNVYTTGHFDGGTVDFDPGAATFNLYNNSSYGGIFISKLNASGNFVWAKELGDGEGKGIALDASGNVYTTGCTRGGDFDPGTGIYYTMYAGSDDSFISKLDASGNFVWAKSIGGTASDYGNSIALDASGNVYTTGIFKGPADFDPGAGIFNLSGSDDIFISKLDASGNFVWAKSIVGSSFNDFGYDITIDASGNVLTIGSFRGTADFDPGAGIFNLTLNGVSDIFISKLDASGNFVWAKAIGGAGTDEGFSIATDAVGNVFTTGGFNGTVDFDPSGAIFSLTGAMTDIFISKLDAAGNFVWAKALGGSSFYDGGKSIALDASGSIYTTGYFNGTPDFDPGAAIYNYTSAGGTDIFVLKLATSCSLSASGSQTNVSCYGGSNGTATVTATSGTPAYTYSWSPSGGTAATATGLTAGNYTCTVTDAGSCTATQTFTITQPTAIVVSIASQSNVTCYGGNNGSASVNASGGTGTLTYNWTPGNPTGDGTASVSGLTAGTWTCTVTDANSCSSTQVFTITQAPVIAVAIASQSNNTCNGGSNGTAAVNASGGTGSLYFDWTPGNPTGDGTNSVTALFANTWTCSVSDDNGCSVNQLFTITQPSAIVVTIASQSNVSCNGGNNGAASVNASGGTGTLTYNWTPGNPTGDGTASVTGLTAGTWTCTVTDANSCTASRIINITQPTAIVLTPLSQTNVSCNAGNNGAANVSATGGVGTLTYNWTPGNPTGDGTASVTGLTAGSWTCTVTDANSCTTSQAFTITQPAVLVASIASQTNVSCFGGTNGAASVSVSGGTTSYSYNWTPGNPTGDGTTIVTGLTAGSWTCTVTDANSCTTSQSFTITQPAVLVASIASQTNVSCFGGTNGAASVSVSGGTTSYSYNWTPGNPTGDGTTIVTGLTVGSWTCTVTDANSCTTSQSFTITQPAVLVASIASQTNVSCFGGTNGAASVSVSGGTTAYSYNWTPSGGSADIASGLTAGNYTCTITDANSCTTSQAFTITQPAAISGNQSVSICAGQTFSVGSNNYSAAGTFTDVLIASNGCDSTVTTNLTITPLVNTGFGSTTSGLTTTFLNNSTSATTYSWNFGDGTTSSASNPVHTFNYGGIFNVCLTASNGCSSQTVCQTVTVTCSSPLASFTTNINGLAIDFTSTSVNAAHLSWDFGDGNSSNLENPNYVYYASGTYTVCLTVTNACGTNTSCQTITVTCAAPVAIFNATVSGLTASFNNTSTNAAISTWYFGDSQTSNSNSPSHVYTGPGTYTVTLAVSNACGIDSLTQTVIVNCALPVANFISSQTGLSSEFVSTSTNASSVHWDFGDGATSISPYPAPHVYPGTAAYTVCLIATNGCGTDTLCTSINICTPPVASFNSNYSALTGTFTNTTPTPSSTTFLWTFGDATATNIVNPIHLFNASGAMNVCLTATNICGTTSICETDTVYCAPLMSQGICMVTVDTSNNHNIIYWDKTGLTGVDSFRIYREVATGVWSHIASVADTALSEYHDNAADASVSQWAYKIAVLDTCGVELPKSLYHYTIHLQVLGGGNLQWSYYSIESSPNPVNFYQVYRDDYNTGNFLPISLTIPGSFNTYTDINYALYPSANYLVQVDWSISCSPTRTAINTSHSNIHHQSFATAMLSADEINNSIHVYPNPANEKVIIELGNLIGQHLKIMNAIGQVVYAAEIKNKKIEIDLSDLANGIYTVQVQTANGTVVKKLVKN